MCASTVSTRRVPGPVEDQDVDAVTEIEAITFNDVPQQVVNGETKCRVFDWQNRIMRGIGVHGDHRDRDASSLVRSLRAKR